MAAETMKRYGRIECAFSNAGIEGMIASRRRSSGAQEP
jgi:hypothetical protein